MPAQDDLDAGEPQPSSVRIAFIGDQALTQGARDVLQLIAREGADLAVHAGDFDYRDDPDAWLAQIDDNLGADVPYVAVVGNHDVAAWDGEGGYRGQLRARLASYRGLTCWGDYGVNAACDFHGVLLVLSGVGTLGSGHTHFIERTLTDNPAAARLCVWHKNQSDMQVGIKADEVGWGAYRACQAAGAFVVTGHAHAYARTYGLADVGNGQASHGAGGPPDLLDLRPGRVAVSVTALAGHSTRSFNPEHAGADWWASIYTGKRQVVSGALVSEAPDITFGALFVDFALDAEGRASGEAAGYFKPLGSEPVDRFELRFQ